MSHAPSAALSRRHQTIRREMETRGLDALVVTSLPNILYLTNFTVTSAILVLTANRLDVRHRLSPCGPLLRMRAARRTSALTRSS